jgi:hypothetical protein
MGSDLALKIVVVFMVLLGAFFMWYTTGATDEVRQDVEGGLLSRIPFLGDIGAASGLGDRSYCPFINPYMAELFSAGSIEVPPGHPLHDALDASIEGGCDAPISAALDGETAEYVIECQGVGSARVEPDKLAELLNAYVGETFSLKQRIPLWQCFLFFGVLPFAAMFFFLRDILAFTMLSPKVKTLVTLFASALAIMTGAFARFVWQLAYVAAVSVQATFLIILLFLTFLSVIMSWIGSINTAIGQSKEQAAELSAGLAQKYTFAAMSDLFRKE